MDIRIGNPATDSLQHYQSIQPSGQASRRRSAQAASTGQPAEEITDVRKSFPVNEALSPRIKTGGDISSPPFSEIQQIAARAGFVGVTERDIMRAYQTGGSLLADYRA